MQSKGLRIIAGRFRGRRLVTPAGLDTRPTPDKVREALFSILGERVRDARVLDLFAGSGALGMEALSRGARRAVFVESAPAAIAALRRNIDALGLQADGRIVPERWPAALRQAAAEGGPFSLIFADPPYERAPYPKILRSLSGPGILEPSAILVVEHERGAEIPEEGGGLKLSREVAYGRVALAFYVAASASSG